ncbi:MAG: MFS transporter [Chlamydiota bacterium]|nr:MFS transporter [Chlamydiota bacterium]
MTTDNNNKILNIPNYKHPIRGLLLSQFLGAFNDNAWKIIVFTLATRSLISGNMNSAEFEYGSQMKATLALMVFLIPMLIFSLPAGSLADRNSKRSVIIWMKALEVFLMASATLSLLIAPMYLALPYFLLAMMGVQSALFSPAKYGILPQVLPYNKLSKGNGFIEMFTMLAIITGTGLGPIMLAADNGGKTPSMTWTGPLILTLLSIAGLAAALTVPKVKPARTVPLGVVKTVKLAFSSILQDRILLLAILGNVLLWLITSLLGQNVLVYAKTLVKHLEKGELLQGVPPASFGIGIAIGALLGGKLSGNRIEYGLIPFGSIGFAIMSMLLGLIQPEITGTVVILILMGISAGMLIVPLKAIVQWRSPNDQKGAVIALGNVFDILGMITGSLLAAGMAYIGMDLGKTLIASSLIVVAATLFSVRLLPEALTRLFFIILTTTFYKIRIKGKEHIPQKGGALLVSNHLSATDAFFVMASIDRPVRFIMSENHYNKWWLKPFALAMNAIPVPYSGKPTVFKNALREAGKHLQNGALVCIFPEGQVSRTGMMQPFREGVEEIIHGCDCPIIPVNLDRVWGTIFSPRGGRYIPRRPQNIPHPLTVSFGTPLAADTPFSKIRSQIRKMGCDAWMDRKDDEVPIHLHFIRSVWRAPWKLSLADSENKKVSRLKVLTSSIVLARILKEVWKNQKTVGIMLPPSLAGVMTNIAASISGRTVANFNYTSSQEDLAFCMQEAEIKTIVTSHRFQQKVQITYPDTVEVIYLEDIKPNITSQIKITSALLGLLAPMQLLEKVCGCVKKATVDDLLTIIFTSGSTGRPKGVMLSHFNVSSNVEAVSRVVPATTNKDKLLHTLPLFHSFGYMTMWLGLNHGLPLVMHPNPLDAAGVGELVKQHKITMMWTTPSFLKSYIPQITPDMFGALRFVLTGAEKLPDKIADAFQRRFGIRPVEGYGTTECSPVIAASTLDVRLPGVYQAGSVKGSVGQPLPGVRTKVVDHNTFEDLPSNHPGLLLVKGPNVMKGYLNHEYLTNEVMHNGWYITGDIAIIDDNDYISITDRLSRFSKIGGEMVPHGRIEEALHSLENVEEQVFVVTSIPNEKKGESLAVLHTLEEGKIHSILQKLAAQDLPRLYIPRFDHFIKVKQLPLLGSGKIDLKAVKQIALEELG